MTVGALLAEDMLGTTGLCGRPAALFTFGSAVTAVLDSVPLLLLGLGWNRGLLAGTTLVAGAVRIDGRARVHGQLDVAVALAGDWRSRQRVRHGWHQLRDPRLRQRRRRLRRALGRRPAGPLALAAVRAGGRTTWAKAGRYFAAERELSPVIMHGRRLLLSQRAHMGPQSDLHPAR